MFARTYILLFAESLSWAGIRMQKAITMHHHCHAAAVMESEQTAVTSAFMQTGLVVIENQIVPRIIMSSRLAPQNRGKMIMTRCTCVVVPLLRRGN
jgi:hypothetical protein